NGTGSPSAAVRAVSARVDVEDDCPASPDGSGRCAAACSTTGPQIEVDWNFQNDGIDAIVLDDAPGSRVERSAICAPMLVNDATAIRVTGDGTGVLVRGNNVIGRASTTENFLLRMEDCAGASPWVVQNYGIELKNSIAGAGGPDASATIRAAGDCHPVIEANRVIHGFGGSDPVTVVTCTSRGNVASRCVVTNNPDVSAGYMVSNTSDLQPGANAVAVDCSFGCSRVDHNKITGIQAIPNDCGALHCSRNAVGLNLNGGSTWVSSNRILGGALGFVRATGVSMADPQGRLENNVIFGTNEPPAPRGQTPVIELAHARVAVGLSSYSGDVDSNFIAGSDGALTATDVLECASDGVDLSGGSFRNNIITGGRCGLSILRLGSTAAPTTFEHNALYNGAVTASEYDYLATGALLADYALAGVASGTLLFTAADVDTKLGGAASFAEPCAQTSDRHLAGGSACIDAGTLAGAPQLDIDGEARDTSPDVGPDEYRP
ncbi:MAG TPA: hypothetical protein VLJ38_21660, partial [Polyangiaceae bacterium]|nr:hypothetical protein [Polyangiaceae bacterium]